MNIGEELHECRENFNNIKKGMKTVKWMKLRIKSMIWNIRKQITTNQNKKKKELKKKHK